MGGIVGDYAYLYGNKKVRRAVGFRLKREWDNPDYWL